MFFGVEFPQLEQRPGVSRSGLRRYPIQKNDESNQLVIGLPSIKERSKSSHLSPIVPRQKQTLKQLKKDLKVLDKEISHLRSVKKSREYRRDRVISTLPSSEELYTMVQRKLSRGHTPNEYMNGLKKPSFLQQERFTKRNPKIFDSNPITGYVSSSFD